MEGYRLGPVLTDKVISVVKRVEDMPYRYGNASIPVRFEEDGFDGGGGEVRLGKTTAAWLRNTSQQIEIWDEGDAPDEEISSPLVTVTAYNKSYDVAACVWVLIAKAKTGEWYLVEAATPDPSEGCAAPNIGGHDLTTISGYASNKKQALTHDENACLKWVDIEDCA